MSEKAALLVVAHGSREAAANRAFLDMVERLNRRAGAELAGAFLGSAEPSIPAAAAELARRGVRRIHLMPWFLSEGRHAREDLPALAAQCERELGISVRMVAGLQGERLLDEIILDRSAELVEGGAELAEGLPATGEAIAAESGRIIDARLGDYGLTGAAREIARRVIHATADFSFARTLRVSEGVAEAAARALRERRAIVCDVRMVQAGITASGCELLCAVDQADVAASARREGTTRAASAMAKLADRIDGAILAIGNAPTALWKVLELARAGVRPAVVVGLPVGFVGARESKLALLASGLCCVTNTTCRGGSPVAAAAVNALAAMGRRDAENIERGKEKETEPEVTP